MSTVTGRIKEISQPYGGYLPVKDFKVIKRIDDKILEEENIHKSLVGLAVDYLTRVNLGTQAKEAFTVSLIGSTAINEFEKAKHLISLVKGLDDISIISACKLSGYDVCYRADPSRYKNVDEIEPDEKTIKNIRIMVERSLSFFDEYGPIVKDGFTFEGGYTQTVCNGDGDFLTRDTLWDFKVLSGKITSKHTLQILMYYIMGNHSVNPEFKNIEKIGIFNPRLNEIYIKNVSDIREEIISEIEENVICYGKQIVEQNKNPGSKDSTNTAKKEISKLVEEETDYLTVVDIMKIMDCSRYQVMKRYSQDNMPLHKKGNKYYIGKIEFYEWYEKYQEKIRKKNILIILVTVFCLIILLSILFKYIPFC